jgi:hypothetical protein
VAQSTGSHDLTHRTGRKVLNNRQGHITGRSPTSACQGSYLDVSVRTARISLAIRQAVLYVTPSSLSSCFALTLQSVWAMRKIARNQRTRGVLDL